jgi:hypothetical protein
MELVAKVNIVENRPIIYEYVKCVIQQQGKGMSSHMFVS